MHAMSQFRGCAIFEFTWIAVELMHGFHFKAKLHSE